MEQSLLSEKHPLATVQVDVIVPIHNAAETIEEAVRSAMSQIIPNENNETTTNTTASIPISSIQLTCCCYDDGSTDDSFAILQRLVKEYQTAEKISGQASSQSISSNLRIAKATDGVSRGAGFARNRAIDLGRSDTEENEDNNNNHPFLCMLDSDDVMRPTRVHEQVQAFLKLSNQEDSKRTLMGCRFERDPPDSTWHYTEWANALSHERLYLERFREVTLLQPTWMMYQSWFDHLQGYVEAPHSNKFEGDPGNDNTTTAAATTTNDTGTEKTPFRLVHPTLDTPQTLRVAEDLRLFHAHLVAGGKLQRVDSSLVIYRHRAGQSQSSQTPRRLLLQLRVRALEHCVLLPDWQGPFCVWGAGRDGKDFVKALRPELRSRVACMADVDEKKIGLGFYVNRDLDVRIPIVHFSLLAPDPTVRQNLQEAYIQGGNGPGFGRIDKTGKHSKIAERLHKKPKATPSLHAPQLDHETIESFQKLPVVVCVALHRTNGALEHNVSLIGRVEGQTFWHFS